MSTVCLRGRPESVLHRIRTFPFRIFACGLLLASGIAHATESRTAENASAESLPVEAIQIFAERLTANNAENYVEFRGNVRAVQGGNVITSDRLKLYYEGRETPDNASRFSEQNISRIIAWGNVLIRFDDRNAQTERAEYDLRESTLVLTGENSKVSIGDDYIVGRKIILRRKENSVTVEGTDQKPVEALFHGAGNQVLLN